MKRSEIRLYAGAGRDRVEQEMVKHIWDYLTNAITLNARGETYYKCSGRAVFVERMMMFLIRSRIAKPAPHDKGTLNDLRSESRLLLIFDWNVRRWRRSVKKPPLCPLKYL